jgi:hypothetical protein
MSLRQASDSSKIAQKRLFVGLLAVSLALLVFSAGLAWWVVLETGNVLARIILAVVLTVMVAFFILMGLGLFVMVWSIWNEKEIKRFQFVIYSVINVLYPFSLSFGKLFGVDEDWIKNSFIQVSNHMVRTRLKGRSVKRVLILAPHCIQWSECPHKITIEIENCQECGHCLIGSLKQLASGADARLAVATGGTAARQIIKDYRPQGVVAIACERDLTSGIRDMSRFAVLGVLNERPNGPCFTTRVDLRRVEEAVRQFQRGTSASESDEGG